MKIKSMFDINQGHQITDEELYITLGDIPVLTGKNEVKGYWNKALVEQKDLPCITYPTKANSGEAFVQHSIFDANNTAVLIPKDEWRPKLNLEWVALKLSNVFLDIPTSKDGVNYLNRAIVEEVDLDVPDTDIQDEEFSHYKKLLALQTQIETILARIKQVKSKPLIGLSVSNNQDETT
jgi:hypothetical protein